MVSIYIHTYINLFSHKAHINFYTFLINLFYTDIYFINLIRLLCVNVFNNYNQLKT